AAFHDAQSARSIRPRLTRQVLQNAACDRVIGALSVDIDCFSQTDIVGRSGRTAQMTDGHDRADEIAKPAPEVIPAVDEAVIPVCAHRSWSGEKIVRNVGCAIMIMNLIAARRQTITDLIPDLLSYCTPQHIGERGDQIVSKVAAIHERA